MQPHPCLPTGRPTPSPKLGDNAKTIYLTVYAIVTTISFLLSPLLTFGQKAVVPDSVWCDNLDNIIRCASMDQILEPVGRELRDSSYIAAITPGVRLTKSATEKIGKQYNKVTYTAYLYSSPKADKNLEAEFTRWYKKVKACLSMWEDAKLLNEDKSLAAYEDRFLTNSEDETSVRLDIVHQDGYHVRIRISLEP